MYLGIDVHKRYAQVEVMETQNRQHNPVGEPAIAPPKGGARTANDTFFGEVNTVLSEAGDLRGHYSHRPLLSC